MPELPEVETIRLQMEKEIVGKIIAEIWLGKEKMWQGDKELAIGKKVTGIERKGKILILRLSEDAALLFHLKLSGQLILSLKSQPKPQSPQDGGHKYTRMIITFADGEKLYFNDPRTFGWVKGISDFKYQISNIIGKLGPEPFDKEFSAAYLRRTFSKTLRPIKQVLMDQEKIAGIGNIYANEALFEAGISPVREAGRLRDEDIKKLRGAIIKVLKKGLEYGGSSGADEQYRNLYGQKGKMQEHFNVYQRQGKLCLRCGETIKRVNLGGRGTFYCERCQT